MQDNEKHLIEKYRKESREMDEYELDCRTKGTKVLILAILCCTLVAAVIRSIHGNDVRDLVFIFCGGAGIFQLYMSIKSKKYSKYLLAGIVSLVVAVMALIRCICLG